MTGLRIGVSKSLIAAAFAAFALAGHLNLHVPAVVEAAMRRVSAKSLAVNYAPLRVEPRASLALRHATVLDGRGGPPLTDATVIVSNGRIAAVGPSVGTPVPRGAHVLDLGGNVITPGSSTCTIMSPRSFE